VPYAKAFVHSICSYDSDRSIEARQSLECLSWCLSKLWMVILLV